MMRGDLAQRQLLGAVSAGAATPEALLRPLYPGPVREALRRHGGIPARRRARAAGADRGRPAALVRQSSGSLLHAGIPQDQGGRAVAADAGEGYPDHRRGPAGGLRAAQGAVREAGEALGRGDLGGGRGQGQGAGRHLAGRRRLGGDAEGGAGRRRLGDRAGRCDRAGVPRSGPGAQRCSPPRPTR